MRGLPPVNEVPVPLIVLHPAHFDEVIDELPPTVYVFGAFLDQVERLHRILGEAILRVFEQTVQNGLDIVLQEVEMLPDGLLEDLEALHQQVLLIVLGG